jgi:hypothetical protein
MGTGATWTWSPVGGERPETFGEVKRPEAGERVGSEGRRPVER